MTVFQMNRRIIVPFLVVTGIVLLQSCGPIPRVTRFSGVEDYPECLHFYNDKEAVLLTFDSDYASGYALGSTILHYGRLSVYNTYDGGRSWKQEYTMRDSRMGYSGCVDTDDCLLMSFWRDTDSLCYIIRYSYEDLETERKPIGKYYPAQMWVTEQGEVRMSAFDNNNDMVCLALDKDLNLPPRILSRPSDNNLEAELDSLYHLKLIGESDGVRYYESSWWDEDGLGRIYGLDQRTNSLDTLYVSKKKHKAVELGIVKDDFICGYEWEWIVFWRPATHFFYSKDGGETWTRQRFLTLHSLIFDYNNDNLYVVKGKNTLYVYKHP